MKRPSPILIALLLTASGCGSGADSVTDTTTISAQPSSQESTTTVEPAVTSSSEKETTTVPDSPPPAVEPFYTAGDIDAGLQFFIDGAVEDLAAQLKVDTSDITTHAAVIVVWSDSSLGCPQPGMSYAQVLVDGSIIELSHDGLFYRYHTGGKQGPFLCQPPLTKRPSR